MSERRDEIREALERIGMPPGLVEAEAARLAQLERQYNARVAATAYEHAVALRDRGDPITLDQAFEVYRQLEFLRTFGARRRVTGRDKQNRDALIYFWLSILSPCMPVTSHPDDQSLKSARFELPDDDRRPCLAWAMAKATGIGESTIGNVWAKYSRTRENTADGWERTGLFWTKWG